MKNHWLTGKTVKLIIYAIDLFLQSFGFFLETNFRLTEVAKIIQGISVHASPHFPSDNISQCISKPGHWQWHDAIS